MTGQPPSPPAFHQQTKAKFGLFQLPKYGTEVLFNPTIARDAQGVLWLFVRRNINRATGQEYNDIVAYPIDRDGKVSLDRVVIGLPQGDGLPGREHFEDPRSMLLPSGNILLSYCTFVPHGSWAHQAVAVLNKHDLSVLGRFDPVHGRNYSQANVNDGHEKNWVWFYDKNRLLSVYSHNPMQVVHWDGTMEKVQVHQGTKIATWPWGEIRGGTNPVKVGDLWWTFFHSSTHWRDADGKRCYHMAALAFKEVNGVFELHRISRKPILSGTYHEMPYDKRFPICVFPGGAELVDGEWFVVMGLNDIECGWIKLSHEEITRTTTEDLNAPALQAQDATTPSEPRKRRKRGKRATRRSKPVLARVRAE